MTTAMKVESEAIPAPSAAERRALIDRVARSSQFARSTRLRDFLLYVGYGSLESGASEIREHAVGVHVFGRLPDYDRSQDNIVRVNATELRKRIDRYFEAEGASEPLIFTIPRGGYTPVYQCRELPIEQSRASTPLAQLGKVAAEATRMSAADQPSKLKIPWAWAIVTGVLLLSCCVLGWQNHALRKSTDVWAQRPLVADFWTGFVKAAPQTDIVLPDASVTLGDEITYKSLSLWDYIHGNFPGSAHGNNMSVERRQDLDTIFAHNLVTLGDFEAAQQLLALTPIAPSLHLSQARFFEAASINNANVILIGGKKANPWAGLFDDQLNFILEDADGHTLIYVVNRHPLAGEPANYYPSIGQSDITAYSVVAFLPNLGKNGKVILLAGTDSDATAAAAAFLTSEEGLSSIRARLHTAHIGYFEALLKTSSLHGAPFSAELLSVRSR